MTSPMLGSAGVSAQAVRLELARLLESREIRNSPQLRKLLEFLVEETLAGRAESLKEYSVGLSVFQRGADFDPRHDSIVRVQASTLRKKLEAHYTQPGTSGGLQIRIPRGSYVPEWDVIEPALASTPPPPAPATRRAWLWAAAGVAAGAGAMAGGMAWWQREQTPQTLAPALWGTFLQPQVETIVSFGAPLFFIMGNGVYVRDVRVNRKGDGDREQLEKISQSIGDAPRPQEDVYTGIGETVGVHLVSDYLRARRVTTKLANSHYLGPPDLSGRNLVIVSSMRFQTLLDSLRLPHAFEFNPTNTGSLRNLRPLPGEPASYGENDGLDRSSTSYARITLWPSASPEHRILSLSGRETWATQAAAQYAVDPVEQRALEMRLMSDPPQGPRGTKSPYFEILLKVQGKNNRVQQTSYLTHRYLEVPLPLRFW